MSEPFRCRVREAFDLTRRGTAVTGYIESGEVRVGDVLRVERSGGLVTVRAVEGVLDRDWTADMPAPVGLVVPDLTPEEVHEGDYLVSA
jgi:selenocysteine-specific translation elongation factor